MTQNLNNFVAASTTLPSSIAIYLLDQYTSVIWSHVPFLILQPSGLNVAVTQSALKYWCTIKYVMRLTKVIIHKNPNKSISIYMFRSIPTLLWPPPAKSSAPCAYSDPCDNEPKKGNHASSSSNALSSFAAVMPIRKRGSLGRKTVKSKVVEHTRAAEAPDEKRARLQADQVHHSLARAAETPEQYQVRLQSQVRQNASRAAETPEQRQSRLHDDQVRHRAARAAETPIQHVVHLLGVRRKRNVAITLKWRAQMYDGFMYNPRYDYESNNLNIGRMSNVESKCSALKWKGETPGMCCSSGKVKLPPILKPPEPLCSLLKGETAQSKDFVKHIRLFNNMFAMTSFKSNVVLNNGWTPTFKVQGQVYHHAGCEKINFLFHKF
ncbi:ATP-dependent DNA helicase [Trichonephila clavipes]|nr:ATP-dependent DNA helicase [Trichonephila clavipes]